MGPNGFVRQFAAMATTHIAKILINLIYIEASIAVKLNIDNSAGLKTVIATITDNAYDLLPEPLVVIIAAGTVYDKVESRYSLSLFPLHPQ